MNLLITYEHHTISDNIKIKYNFYIQVCLPYFYYIQVCTSYLLLLTLTMHWSEIIRNYYWNNLLLL